MNDVITSILTDASTRSVLNIEDALLAQAVASPWVNE